MEEESACERDSDCPGAHICYSGDLSWRNGTSLCECMSWYGKFGPDCDQLTPYFYVSVVVILLNILGALTLARRSFRDARIVSKRLGGLTASSSNAMPAFTTASAVSLAAWKLSFLLEFLVPMQGNVITLVSGGHKRPFLVGVTGVLLVVMSTLIPLGLLTLSLMWLQASRQAVRVSHATQRKMNIYRTACIVVGSMVTIGNMVLVATANGSRAVLVGVPLALLLGVLFIVGSRGMEALLHSGSSLAGKANPRLKSRLERTAKSIRRCCNRTVICVFAFVGSSMLWFAVVILGPHGGNGMEFTRIGVGCWPQLTYELIPLALLGALHTQCVYCHESITTRLDVVHVAAQATTVAVSSSQPMRATTFARGDTTRVFALQEEEEQEEQE